MSVLYRYINFYEYNKEFIENLKAKYLELEEILNFISDKNHHMRKFMKILGKEPGHYKKITDAMQRELLISCYAVSENMIKEFIYCILEYKEHKNAHINKFLDDKISEDRFSPNVKYENIKKELSKYFSEHKFIFKKTKQEVKSYENLISNRHSYAHNNNYRFEYNDFGEAIQTIEYIYYELYSAINNLELQKNIKEITSKIEKIKKINNIEHFKKKSKEITVIKKLSKEIVKQYDEQKIDIELIKPLIDSFRNIARLDLRKKSESLRMMNHELINI
ncbi:TPA: hypothetical protein ACF84J_002694, partial [Staphylococcus aureus]